jgi:hypothetical protein
LYGAHGDYVLVEALQADHMQAAEHIQHRQKELIDKLNEDNKFANFLMQQPGMGKFFVQVDGKYYGTVFFYELYFNDIDNIWLICNACNLHKSDEDTLSWLQEQWAYGPEFLDHLSKLQLAGDKAGILKKTERRTGLAQVAIDWFWDKHANYISIAQRLMENVTVPLTILNRKVDHIIGLGQFARSERLKASLEGKIEITEAIVAFKGMAIPKNEGESPHSSSDEDDYMTPLKDKAGNPVSISPATYTKAAESVANKAGIVIKNMLKEEISAIVEEREKEKIPQNKS